MVRNGYQKRVDSEGPAMIGYWLGRAHSRLKVSK